VAETIRGAVDSVRVAFEEPIREDLPEGVLLKYEYVLVLFANADSTFHEGEAWFLTRVAAGEYRIKVFSSTMRPKPSSLVRVWSLLRLPA
jgi:hypothetical protein